MTSKNDQEKRILSLETEFDSQVGELNREMEDVKQQVVSSLNKKADFSLLERLRETALKKVDLDYMQSQLIKVKQDISTQIELAINEQKYQRRAQESTQFEERSNKALDKAQLAFEEINLFKQQLKQLQDERKKDVEETAEFINQLITNSKGEQMQESQRMMKEIEHLRRDVAEKVPTVELLETKSNFIGQLESKVELNEVQSALSDCQQDIVQQLDEFKQSVQ